MTIEKKSVSLCVVELTIKAESAEFQAEYDKVEKEYLKNASIPGFRKGKIPLPLLRSKFAKDIKSDASSAIFRMLYPKAIEQGALAALQERGWSGNIRELRNAVERLIILSGEKITEQDVRLYC